jgi:hypothetical protein
VPVRFSALTVLTTVYLQNLASHRHL